jgi:hypothetical protein
MSGRMSRIAYLLIFAGVALFIVNRSTMGHHMVVRCNLEEMTQRADRIFLGECMAVNETHREIAQGNMAVTDYTFKVESVIKGSLPSVFTFTQLGHPGHLVKAKPGDITMHGQVVTAETLMHGAPSYNVGDRLLLFLVPPHLDGTISSTVGLYQGAFFRTTMPSSGQEVVRNQINNTGLFTTGYNGTDFPASQAKIIFPDRSTPIASNAAGVDVEALGHKRGPLPTASIVALVKQINAAHGGQPGTIIAGGRGALR